MKATLFFIVLLAFGGISIASQAASSISVSSESPALRVENVRIDPREGKVRGTVYLNFGYAVPRLPHVHVYALDTSNKIIRESCDPLNGSQLATIPRYGQGRASFFGDLPLNSRVAKIKIILHSKENDCIQGTPLSRTFRHLSKNRLIEHKIRLKS